MELSRSPGETQWRALASRQCSQARCEINDSQLYQWQNEKYGSCDDCFFGSNCVKLKSQWLKILVHSCFSGSVKCQASSMRNDFKYPFSKLKAKWLQIFYARLKMVQFWFEWFILAQEDVLTGPSVVFGPFQALLDYRSKRALKRPKHYLRTT